MKLLIFISTLVLLISCSCGGKSEPYSDPSRKPNKVVRKQDSLKEEKKIDSIIKDPFIPPVIPVVSIISDPEPFYPIVGCGYYPPDCPTYDTVKTTSDFVLQFAEIMPEFPGGAQSMQEFIKNNINYPDLAKENNIEGKVFMKFVVRSTGEIDNIQIVRGVHKVLDTAAMELVKKMPRWIPGVQNGKTVPVYFILPVVFRLD
jgi:TonB family protein